MNPTRTRDPPAPNLTTEPIMNLLPRAIQPEATVAHDDGPDALEMALATSRQAVNIDWSGAMVATRRLESMDLS